MMIISTVEFNFNFKRCMQAHKWLPPNLFAAHSVVFKESTSQNMSSLISFGCVSNGNEGNRNVMLLMPPIKLTSFSVSINVIMCVSR